jgi:site-specific DNA-methyltransferase (adenine-specific)
MRNKTSIEIYNEDCLTGMNKVKDKSIDLIFTDLPYGTTDCSWDSIIPFNELWNQYKRIIKDNGCILLFGTGIFFAELALSNKEWFRYELIWEKERPTNIFFLKKQFAKVHESIAVFYKEQPKYFPIMENRVFKSIGIFKGEKTSKTHDDQTYKYSDDYDKTKTYPRSVLKFNRDTLKGSLHPTQKPVSLLEYLIKTYTEEGDLVLDSCMGSGSTMIACKSTKRNGIGFEIDEDIFKVAQNRIKKFNYLF